MNTGVNSQVLNNANLTLNRGTIYAPLAFSQVYG